MTSARAGTGRKGAVALAAVLVALLFQAAGARGDVYWGGLISGETYGEVGNAPENSAAWEHFERHTGKKVAIVSTGQPWLAFDAAKMNAIHSRGAIPLVTLGLAEGVTLTAVKEGKQDAQIRAWAKAAKQWAHPFYLVPWWEMNGNWFSWGQNPDFVAAWRHFHDLVKAEGATNVTWTWVPNILWHNDPLSDLSPYYPGAAYVDWTGFDGYNWGRNPAQPDSWHTPAEVFDPSLARLDEFAADKPVVIVENASTEFGGDKANWIREMLGEYLPRRPQIGAYLWFNWNDWKNGLRDDWQIESSAGSQQAFRDGIASSFFHSTPVLPDLKAVPRPQAPGGGEAPQLADLSLAGARAASPQIAVAPGSDTATVVWSEEAAGENTIHARQVDRNGIAQPPLTISTPGEDAFGAEVASGPDGSATVVWAGLLEEEGKANYVIRARRIDPEGGLDPIQSLSAVGRDASDPRIAIAPGGVATVVWKRWNGSNFLIKDRRIEADGTVEVADADTPSAAGQDAVEPRVAVGADGTATLIWSRFDGSSQRIQARQVAPNGALSAGPVDLSAAGAAAIEPREVVGPDRRVTVVWTRVSGSIQVVQARGISSGGSVEASTYDLSATGASAVEPEAAVGSDGKITVVWDRLNTGTSSFVVQARKVGPGGAPLAAVANLSGAEHDAVAPQVAVAPDGSATAVWSRSDGADTIVQRVGIAAGGATVGSVANVSKGGRDAGDPQLALRSDATPLIVWRRFDGAEDRVQGSPLAEPHPELELSPSTHDFGSVTVGADPVAQVFELTSSGNAPVSIASISISGPDAGAFTLRNVADCTSKPLAAGATCEIEVGFGPSTAGQPEATIEVQSDAPSSPDAATLSATAIAPPPLPPSPPPQSPASLTTTTRDAEQTSHAEIDNRFSLGKTQLRPKRGIALLPISVPGPGEVTLSGGRADPLRFAGAGSAKLLLRAGGAKRRLLLRSGYALLRVRITFAPEGGAPSSRTRTVRLRKSPDPRP